jgi:hypothetical protein
MLHGSVRLPYGTGIPVKIRMAEIELMGVIKLAMARYRLCHIT